MSNIVSSTASTQIQNLLTLALDNAILQKKNLHFLAFFCGEGLLGGLKDTIGHSAQAAQLGRTLKSEINYTNF